MDVHPTKNVSIGIDPYPYDNIYHNIRKVTIIIIVTTINISKNNI